MRKPVESIYKDLRTKIFRWGNKYIYPAHTIKLNSTHPAETRIESDDFRLPNGGNIRFFISFTENNGEAIISSYSYHYTSEDGNYIRYEKDPKRADGMAHPLYHAHLNSNSPRYPTEHIDFLDFLEFIIKQIQS